MTVVVQDPEGQILVITKGADTVLFPLVKDDQFNNEMREKTLNHLYEYANQGLRTLLVCKKVIDNQFYRNWAKKYEQAKNTILNQDQKVKAVISELECDYDIQGATAIEDRLQDDVSETINTIKKAGIKFWMLTGDKVETAINIGYSCGVLDQ